jgi:hypothetical protein
MSDLHLRIPHTLGVEEARRRLHGLLPRLAEQHAGTISHAAEEWTGERAAFSFTIRGMHIRGELEVRAAEVELRGHLPFLAALFRPQIEAAIQREAAALLG